MNMAAIIQQMLILLIIMGLGFAAQKGKIMDAAGNAKISKLLLYVTLPAMTLASVMSGEKTLSNGEVFLLLGLSAFLYGTLIIGGFLLPKLLRVPKADSKLYTFITVFSNVGFMGYPIVKVIFGDEAVFFAAVLNIPFNVLAYSFGVWLISSGKEGSYFDLRVFLNPGIFAAVIGIVIYMANIPFPDLIYRTVDLVGEITTPLSMLIIGASLGAIPLRRVFNDVRVYIFSVFRLVLIPLAIFGVLRLFIENQTILGVVVVVGAMPVAAVATIFCTQYKGNVELAAKATFLTTTFSVITTPFLVWLLF